MSISPAVDCARLCKNNAAFQKEVKPLVLFGAVFSVVTQQATFCNEGIAEKRYVLGWLSRLSSLRFARTHVGFQ